MSFWYAHRADGSLAAIVAEVNNTFGERHCYLLRGEHLQWGQELQAEKVFHVSPFCAVEGHYHFHFTRTADRIVARIDALAQDPHPPGSRKLQGGTDEFRIRVGDYRVIYSVNDAAITIVVIRVGHRRDIYR